MLCEEILGNLGDAAFESALRGRLGGEFTVDQVPFDWHEAFKRLHRKTSEAGRDVGVRLGDWVLSRGLSEGDVLGVDEASRTVLAVHLLPTRCLVVDVDPGHPFMLAKVGWEVGNTHGALFYGEGPYQLLCAYTEPVERLLSGLHGVGAHVADAVLDPARRVSANAHHHAHGEDGHEHGHGDGNREHGHGDGDECAGRGDCAHVHGGAGEHADGDASAAHHHAG